MIVLCIVGGHWRPPRPLDFHFTLLGKDKIHRKVRRAFVSPVGLRPCCYWLFLQQEANAAVFGVDLGDKGQKGVSCACIGISRDTIAVESSGSVQIPTMAYSTV